MRDLQSESPVTAFPKTEAKKLFGIYRVPEVLCSVYYALFLVLCTLAILVAVSIRLIAIHEFGTVIHEFDPWFNLRCANYLLNHGWHAFFDWYDYQSWYPLGRPVGTTTFPGLHLTAVAIYKALKFLGGSWAMSLNDVCCYIPAWFAAISTGLVGLTAYECTHSSLAGALASLFMAFIPSHIVRTVGGGFDNESIAIPAMCATFYFWIRSLRARASDEKQNVVCGALAGVCYGFMVALWGGFIYVTNIVALHAGILLLADWLRGTYSNDLYKSYTLYFTVGTAIATCVPPVRFAPFYALEQISALLVFLAMQVMHATEYHRKLRGIQSVGSWECFHLRMRYIGSIALLAAVCSGALYAAGYFGPLTARVQSLLFEHKSTGNPLVDSVAEHQPMTVEGLWLYSAHAFYFTPIGALLAITGGHLRKTSFILLNLVVSWYFAMRMSRLIIFACFPCAVLSGIFLARLFEKLWENAVWEQKPLSSPKRPPVRKPRLGLRKYLPSADLVQRCLSSATLLLLIRLLLPHTTMFVDHCWESAVAHSQPQVVFNHWDGSKFVRIDDYREAYGWLSTRTPSDARVLAWWDYGYHITGIGNRTSLADGNTWNHEHIALIGKCLCAPVTESHRVIRHLADYVLLWTGGPADDIAKSPWIARISNSVYRDVCPNDPQCESFGFLPDGTPTQLLRNSTLFSLATISDASPAQVHERFERVYASEHGLVSIYKVKDVSLASKDWVADPKNRRCPESGVGYCQGRYPPDDELQSVLRHAVQMGH